MTRKHTKRKVWYPKGTGLISAIDGVSRTPESHLNRIRMTELSAIESFAKGVATEDDYGQLCGMVGLAETMIEFGVGPEAAEAVAAAHEALRAARRRLAESGRLAFDGAGLQALRDCFAFHDEQRRAIDRSQYERVIERCRRRLASGHHSFVALS